MLLVALLLGVVEGLTEFLPISSTGHLILLSHLLGFIGQRAETFEVFIQLGAILAVVFEYRSRLFDTVKGLRTSAVARRLVTSVLVAFLPSAVVGLLIHRFVSSLFRPAPVAISLLAGALLILVVEAAHPRFRIHGSGEVGPRQALLIGLAQCLALWPGFSRSAATIMGGLLVGLDRRTATEFSFFLAIPTMFAATFFDLVLHRASLQPGDVRWLALAFVTSFFVALLAIRWLLRFVSSHSFRPFAWYRMALAAVVLFYLYRGGF